MTVMPCPQRYDTTPRMRGLRFSETPVPSRGRYNPAYAGTTRLHLLSSTSLSIQPRVCGDYWSLAVSSGYQCDTTPRMRGLRWTLSSMLLYFRYNPAYAGTTHALHVALLCGAIQPRVCGDYSCAPCRVAVRCDTTPRMRGLRAFRVEFRDGAGYNPAYAGTTAFSYGALVVKSIQPRVCGDYLSLVSYSAFWSDTTPRMRGLPQPWCP